MRTPEEDSLRAALSEYCLPQHMYDSVVLYIIHHKQPGHFLTAVLSNDLKEAVGRADGENRNALVQWVMFMYNRAPAHCWGSPAKVKEWIGVASEK